jgi:hypothetical protein
MAGESMDAFSRLRSERNGEAPRRHANKIICPDLSGSSSFEGILEKMTDALVATGMGGPSGMADGSTMGEHSRPSHEALSATVVELWQQNDRDENQHLAKIACFFDTAEDIKFRHVPFPDAVTDKINAMGAQGLLAAEFKLSPRPVFPSRTADLGFDAEVSADQQMRDLHVALAEQSMLLEDEVDEEKIASLQAEIKKILEKIKAEKEAASGRGADEAHSTPPKSLATSPPRRR